MTGWGPARRYEALTVMPSPLAVMVYVPSEATEYVYLVQLAGGLGMDFMYGPLVLLARRCRCSPRSLPLLRKWITVLQRRDEVTCFRCHVHRLGLEPGQGPSEGLDAGRQRRMVVYHDEGASAEGAKPTAGGRHGRERLQPDLDAELAGHRNEFVEQTVRVQIGRASCRERVYVLV